MSTYYSPNIATDGVRFFVDCDNPKSYKSGSSIWNRALSATEIEQNYIATKGRFGK